MPGSEVEDEYRRLYQLEKSFQEQYSPAVFGGNLCVLDQNPVAQNLKLIGALQNPNLKNNSLQQLESVKGYYGEFVGVPFDQTRALRLEYLKGRSINNIPDKNDFLLGLQNFEPKQSYSGSFHSNSCYDQQSLNSRGISIFKSLQENECADSPTLTTNSERSEITEASGDLNFFGRQEQVLQDRTFGDLNFQSMQQSGYNDMQLLQQHMMLKQMQEFQRQQQLQQLGEMRQQNSMSHISGIAKQGAGSQFSNLMNGMPVHDAPQMLRGWMQRGASPAAQGMPNKVMFSQDQALRVMGLAPQQNDGSLYGTPVSNVRGNMSQYQNIQGMSNESVNLFGKASAQAQKSSVQSPGFGSPFTGNVTSDMVAFPAGSMELKQGLQVKDSIGQVPIQGLSAGLFSGNHDQSNTAQADTSVSEFGDRQDQVGWSPVQQTSKQLDSQNSVPLDPMEAKILYNMDGNIWDAFGGRPDTVAGGFGNLMEQPDSSNAVPSIQSGSWSALMQSAVAEASSSDTGMQEEWSGLTFQNTEHSTDNQILNLMESENRQTGWVDNNLQSQSASSFTSKSFPLNTDTGISSFPGFQQPGIKLSTEERDDFWQDSSRESTGSYKHQQKQSVEEGQRIQASMRSNNLWTGQMFGNLKRDGHNVASHDGSMENKGNGSMGNDHHEMTSGPFVAHNSSDGEHRIYEKQQNFYQSDNTNDGFTSQGFSRQDHVQFEQNKIFGSNFMNVRNVDKTFLSNFQGNSSASEEAPSTNDQDANTSASFLMSDFSDSSKVGQASENMLELLHKVDNSRDESSNVQLGSAANYSSIPNAAAIDTHDTSGSQNPSQSSASQVFGLRLAPPSQRLHNSNSFLPPHGLATKSNQNSTPSFQSMPSSNEQGAHWNNRSGATGNAGLLNSVSLLAPNLSYARNQLQTSSSNVPVASQPWKRTLPGFAGKFPPFGQTPSQDALQQIYASSGNQQFPVLEASAVSQTSNMSSMSQQGEGSPKPHNVWRSVPTQRRSFSTEPTKVPSGLSSSVDLSNSTSWTPHGIHNQNFVEFGASSNLQGLNYAEKHQEDEMQHNTVSNVPHWQEPFSDVSACQPSSLEAQQDLDCGRLDGNTGAASTVRNLGELDHPHGYHKNLASMQSTQALNNSLGDLSEVHPVTALGEQKLLDNSSKFRQPMDSGPDSGSQPSSFQAADPKMLSFTGEASDSPSLKASLQHAFQSRPSPDMGIHGYNESQAQSNSGNVPFNQSNHSPANLHMAPSWFKQYGTLKNGQMVPIFDPRFAKTASAQFSLGRPQIFQSQTSERLGASDVGQVDKVWPCTATALVAAQHLSAPFVLPAEDASQISISRPKKRKFEPSPRVPWHKNASQTSGRSQNISLSEEEWAHATNRLVEKIEYNDMIEDLQPRLRSKRRLILTTQLVQHLFTAGPASIYVMDSASSYHILPYFTARLSLGDACSLTYCNRNNLSTFTNNKDMNSEKLKISEETNDKQMSEIVEAFIDRAKKLEQEFYRLDKTTSIVDVRVDFQDLEKFSIINRFAKFHCRGQLDTSGTSRPIFERYVTALPMPKALPEEAQFISL